MSQLRKNKQLRWFPSYLRNRGHLSKAQRRNLRNLWEKYGITLKHQSVITLPEDRPIILEIGFGQGEHLLHHSSLKPNSLFLGVEVHKPAIASVIHLIDQNHHMNIKLVRSDALVLLSDHMRNDSIDMLCVFFPEPWPTQPHRRLIQNHTLDLIEPKLKDKAWLYFASDIENYTQQVTHTLQERACWEIPFLPYAPRPSWRPLSKYEKKGTDAGRGIFEMRAQFVRTSAETQ